MAEAVPLAEIHAAVFAFLRDRDDIAVFGAQAVNVCVEEPRTTQDVAVLSPQAADIAEELRSVLAERFGIAVRVRRVAGGRGHRVFQVRKPRNRHLIDVRQVDPLPPTRRVGGVLVVSPEELVASKVLAYHARQGRPKSGTDWRDLAMLLLAFPELKSATGAVRERLEAADAEPDAIATWEALVAQEISPEDDDAGW